MESQVEILKREIYKGDNIQYVCDLIIASAVEADSSDIHIEPLQNVVRLRYRVDGKLKEILEYQSYLHPQIIARYKILANLKIDESRMPQDGRISETVNLKEIDLRVSTLPTVHGEKIVMRIVDKSRDVPSLEGIGFRGNNLALINEWLRLPNGIILTSGPTGSGKTTTMYSCINQLNSVGTNIVTLEDPVENVLEGINQSQVHPDIGYSFANGLRTVLRQDPDIVMVGEIRDKETIDIAIEASLTGHLVLSTIHTNSAAETITRIVNMGIQPFLLPASMNIVIAQRLVRKLCPHCKKEAHLDTFDPETQDSIKKLLASIPKSEIQMRVEGGSIDDPVFYQAVGCEECLDTGYKWRIGLFEVMEITNNMKNAILKWVLGVKLHETALKEGMISLEQDGVLKVLSGETTFEEIYSAVKSDHHE